MTTLRETPAPHVRPDPAQRPRRAWRPLELFADHAMAARLWCVVALIAVTLCALQPFLVIRAYRERERVIVLDPSGTFHVSPLLGFEEASKLHEQHALLACLALFQRNPTGFDFPELLDKLFLPSHRVIDAAGLAGLLSQSPRAEASQLYTCFTPALHLPYI